MASDGDRAKALLTYANYAKVAAALHVSRAAVADWAKGTSVTPYRLHQLEQLLRPDLQIEEPPQPQWAGAMESRVLGAIERSRVESLPERVAEQLAVQLGLAQSPGDEDAHEETAVPPGSAGTAPPPKE